MPKRCFKMSIRCEKSLYQSHYLKKVKQIVSNYISAKDHGILMKSTSASEHYAKLQQAFETAFPDSDLSYLINDGVMVWSIV